MARSKKYGTTRLTDAERAEFQEWENVRRTWVKKVLSRKMWASQCRLLTWDDIYDCSVDGMIRAIQTRKEKPQYGIPALYPLCFRNEIHIRSVYRTSRREGMDRYVAAHRRIYARLFGRSA